VVDPSRCEAKGACVVVCPNDVFRVGRIDTDVHRSLRLIARLRVRAHGMQTATTPGADACRACGLCVVACPEGAVRLEAPA
jgi:NAD-dependent dihydropyrimidine dehydrogenase PreA subunit